MLAHWSQFIHVACNMHSCCMPRCIRAGCSSALMLHAGQRLLPYHTTLQYGAVWGSVGQRDAACCSAVQCVAVWCGVSQCVAVCCRRTRATSKLRVKTSVSRHVFYVFQVFQDKCLKTCVSRHVFQGKCHSLSRQVFQDKVL